MVNLVLLTENICYCARSIMYTWKVHWNCQNCLLFKHLLPTRWRKYMQVLQSVLLPTGWIFNKIWWVDGHWDKKITLLFGGLVLIIIWITDTDWLGLPDHDVGRQELTYLIYTVYFFLFCSTRVLSILLSFLYPLSTLCPHRSHFISFLPHTLRFLVRASEVCALP